MKVRDACRHVRSKNAGPYWVTYDFFFSSREHFERYAGSVALGGDLFASLFGADPGTVKRFPVPGLHVLKISHARPAPQGGVIERDLHAGQQYARLLDVEFD